MKKGSWFLQSVLVALTVTLLTATTAEWTGLWRVVQETPQGPIVSYLLVPGGGGKPTYFDSSWRPYPLLEWRLKTNQVSWRAEFRSWASGFKGDRNSADTFSGEAEILHPQYQVKQSIEGRRVLSKAGWSPLEGANRLESAVRLIDVAGYVASKAAKGLEEFRLLWSEELLPDFFVFMTKPPEADRVFTVVSSEKFSGSLSLFNEVYHTVRADLRRTLPGFPRDLKVVTLPFGKHRYETLLVGEQFFLLVDLSRLQRNEQLMTLKKETAQELAEHALRISFPQTANVPFLVFKAGFRSYVVDQLGYATSRASLFNLSDEELANIESKLPDHKKLILRSSETLRPEVAQVVGFQFVQMLAQRYSEAQMLELSVEAVNNEFRAFAVR